VDPWKEIHNDECRHSGDTMQREALAREILEKSQRRGRPRARRSLKIRTVIAQDS